MPQIGEREKAMRAAREAQAAPPASNPSSKLSAKERARLASCEAVIARGLQSFLEVGEALAAVREGELYRESHGTWEAYCRERWRMSGRRGNQLVTGAAMAVEMGTRVPIRPTSEKQVRPLAKLPPEARPGAWNRAVERSGGKQPTASQVTSTVQLVLGSDAVETAAAHVEIEPGVPVSEPAKVAREAPRVPQDAPGAPEPLPAQPGEPGALRALLAAVRIALDVQTNAEILPAIMRLKGK